MTGARQRIYPQDDERPPDAIEKQKLERGNNELRRQVRNLEAHCDAPLERCNHTPTNARIIADDGAKKKIPPPGGLLRRKSIAPETGGARNVC